MRSLRGSFRAAPDLRVRPLPEWDACVVYDPARRRLVELNLTAALALELCDGGGYDVLRRTFSAALGGRLSADEANRLLLSSVLKLIGAGLVIRTLDPDGGNESHA